MAMNIPTQTRRGKRQNQNNCTFSHSTSNVSNLGFVQGSLGNSLMFQRSKQHDSFATTVQYRIAI